MYKSRVAVFFSSILCIRNTLYPLEFLFTLFQMGVFYLHLNIVGVSRRIPKGKRRKNNKY